MRKIVLNENTLKRIISESLQKILEIDNRSNRAVFYEIAGFIQKGGYDQKLLKGDGDFNKMCSIISDILHNDIIDKHDYIDFGENLIYALLSYLIGRATTISNTFTSQDDAKFFDYFDTIY